MKQIKTQQQKRLNLLQQWLLPIVDPLACVDMEPVSQYDNAETLIKTLERQLKEFARQGLAGDKRSLLHGQGLDFSDLRQYFPGDDIRKIDWNVFARTGEPHIKEYQDEKRLTLWVYIDLSPSMFFGANKTKAQLALEMTTLLGILAQSGGHAIGFFIHDGHHSTIIAPKSGLTHVQNSISVLLETSHNVQWKINDQESEAPRLQQGFQEFTQMLRHRGLVFILSDFIDLSTSWEANWGQLARKASLYSVLIQDTHELNPPKDLGVMTLFDAETKSIQTVDWQHQTFRKMYINKMQHRSQQLINKLGQFSQTSVTLADEDPILSLLNVFQQQHVFKKSGGGQS